jgi:hypothetical protein
MGNEPATGSKGRKFAQRVKGSAERLAKTETLAALLVVSSRGVGGERFARDLQYS